MLYLQNYFNAKLFIGGIVENGFKAALKSKAFQNYNFPFFAIFCMTKLKPFSGKAKQSLFKPKFCTRDHFRK